MQGKLISPQVVVAAMLTVNRTSIALAMLSLPTLDVKGHWHRMRLEINTAKREEKLWFEQQLYESQKSEITSPLQRCRSVRWSDATAGEG